MRVILSEEKISPYGGLNFISKAFDESSIESLIISHLGVRPSQSTFSYTDVVKNLFMTFFAGGDCLEDGGEHLGKDFDLITELERCSPDVTGRVLKSLAVDNRLVVSKSGAVHEFNMHKSLNELLLDMVVDSGELKAGEYYDFDFDNQFIPCNKKDSKTSYKKEKGYFPGVSSMNGHIVHIENRNGNSGVKYKQEETLGTAYSLLASRGLQVNRSRMDCGSFAKKIIEVVEKNSRLFYVRAQRCDSLYEQIKGVDKWKLVKVGKQEMEVCSIRYKPFGEDKEYRYVVSREKQEKEDLLGQLNMFPDDAFTYRAIITNDEDSTAKEIIEYYNDRGGEERIFDEMNNDFGWSKLPFSFLKENTVFLLFMAMCRNFYRTLVKEIAEKVPFVKPNFRMKKFIFRFIIVPFKWVSHARQKWLKLYTDKPYHLLI